jgi:HlyD family secretion protein
VKSAKIALDRAKQNLSYTAIYAPIDGVIVERNVDVGQTVAASLSAPQLFLIANDLAEMQILASVDESDIGQIKEGQPVQFTVQSYPGQSFTGTVKQVRLQSTTAENVVSYTAVVAVKNEGGKLLPGMTATVQFQTASANNVLTVPNAALHVTPTAEMLAEISAQRKARDSTQGAARSTNAPNAQNGGAARGARSTTRSPSDATIWAVGNDGKTVRPIRVHTGLTDGQKTEVQAATLTEGTQVVIGLEAGQAASATAAPGSANNAPANPFQPARLQGGRRF